VENRCPRHYNNGRTFGYSVAHAPESEVSTMSRRKRFRLLGMLVLMGGVSCCLGFVTCESGTGTAVATAAEAGEALGVPEGLKGFRGMLIGVMGKKSDREFIIEVEKITRTWKQNKAENPQAAVGKKAVCELWPKGRLYQQHRQTLAGLKPGDRVLVEPFHLEPGDDHLTVVEELKKVVDEPREAEPEKESLGVPTALRGFKGMLIATIVKKGTDELIIKIEKIERTWKGNKAENAKAAVGKQAVCELWKKGRLYEKQRKTLAQLRPGDRVLVEPFHLEPAHDHLTVVEELRKVD
jgi:translation initiation factor IF-1